MTTYLGTVGPLTPATPELGEIRTVHCITNYTVHTGPVVRVMAAGLYADRQVRSWRVVIRDESTGREVISW